MPYEGTKEAGIIRVGVKRVTGPTGFWWFPILERLATIFPWAKLLLQRVEALSTKYRG